MTKEEKLAKLEAMGSQFMEDRTSQAAGKPLHLMEPPQWKGIFQNPAVGPAKRLAAYRLWAPKNPGHDLVPDILDIKDDNHVLAFLKGQDAGRATSKIQG